MKWVQVLRKRNFVIDGIVLTEHRKFDFDKDYSSELAEQIWSADPEGVGAGYEVRALPGIRSERGAGQGHRFFGDVRMDARELMQAARQHDAVALPAHPGRFGIGLTEYIEQGESFPGREMWSEILNGGGRTGEKTSGRRSSASVSDYRGIGGSDAHFTSHIATCMTDFRGFELPTRVSW